ncbi:MAG: cytidylate kinase [Lachnospiraceae bacterium]|jgi:cytidylate kinase|nr:cytidylate kinase [Lachnospiraceae bacterium]
MYVSPQEAEHLVKRANKYRADYYKYYTQGSNWKDSLNYDLTLNSHKVCRNQCVELIKKYVDIKFGK